MRRLQRIFLLHFQYVFSHRATSLVWFIIALVAPISNLSFWVAALNSGSTVTTLPAITTYYFLLIFASMLFISRVEEDVAIEDIYEGRLTSYLLKPFSYFYINLIEELPYRLLQGFFGLCVCFTFFFFFRNLFVFSDDKSILLLTLIMSIGAYFLSFIYKFTLSLITFWTTDFRGVFQFFDIAQLIFAGFILPLDLMPPALKSVAIFLPYSYMLYFPIVTFQGKLDATTAIYVIAAQVAWIVIFILLRGFLWKKGIEKYTAFGN